MNEAATTPTDVSHNAKFKVMVIEEPTGKERVEVYLLNPKDWFEGFGGSRHGLVVGKTASLVTRHYQSHGLRSDTEYDLAAEHGWRWIRNLINEGWKVREE